MTTDSKFSTICHLKRCRIVLQLSQYKWHWLLRRKYISLLFLFSRPFFTSLAVFLYYGAFYGSYFYLTNPEITSASVKRKSISSKPIDQLNLLTWMTNIKKPQFKSFILNSFNDLTSSQNVYLLFFVNKVSSKVPSFHFP